MPKKPRREVLRSNGFEVHVLGGRRPGAHDLYHQMLTIPWWGAAAVLASIYLVLNAIFAELYLLAGGLTNAQPGSFADAFYFSVQTMGTIGYGAIAPSGHPANTLVVVESMVGLGFTAVATGLVFVRFSLQRAQVLFSQRACIGPIDRVPTLSVRVGNERRNRIVDATFRLSLTRTVLTDEGVVMYRAVDLPLVRDRAMALSRAWNVMHRITPGSPLDGVDAEGLVAAEAELTLLVAGIDETTMQPVHAMHLWNASDVAFDHRLADVIDERPDGVMVIDLSRFHDVVPSSS